MVYTDELICPVCGGALEKKSKSLICQNRHCFDISKEGYVNLLYANHKSAERIGDNKDMARSRHAFLEKGYFQSLSNGISDYILLLKKENPVLLDICCGEGYYSKKLLEKQSGELYGFDLSQKMVRLAAKRKLDASFFVANLSHIPMKNACIDIAFHLFAPFHEKEFSRILKKDGVLLSVVPGENHLLQLKESVYETAYKNDEKLPQTTVLKLTDSFKIKDKIFLPNSSDIMSLFKMTPYYYRTAPENMMKAEQLESLETVVEFVVGVYRLV